LVGCYRNPNLAIAAFPAVFQRQGKIDPLLAQAEE